MKWRYAKRTNLPDDGVVFDAEKAARGEYTATELDAFANQMLKEQAREIDPETGKRRGVRGENPILFPEHEHTRRRREILNDSGTPDPSIVAGIYYRAHPEGRKINTPEARSRGASFFKGFLLIGTPAHENFSHIAVGLLLIGGLLWMMRNACRAMRT